MEKDLVETKFVEISMLFKQFKSVQQNDFGRLFAVGDVHGCLDELVELLAKIAFDPSVDQMIFVGDLADRGRQSLATLEYVLDKPYFHVVVGNHEHMLYEHIFGPFTLTKKFLKYWLAEDGFWTHSADDAKLKQLCLKLSEQCHYIIEVKASTGTLFGVTHAGYDGSHWYDPSRDYPDDFFGLLMWSRKRAGSTFQGISPISGIDYTVHGHTVFERPQFKGNSLFIDTGCAIGGALTAVDLGAFAEQQQFNPTTVFSVFRH